MLKIVFYLALSVVCLSHAAILDPALYLSPSPPLTDEPGALDRWLGAPATPSTEPSLTTEENSEPTEEEAEVPQARTFWPLQPSYGGIQSIRGIHIPLTFSLSGSYGTNHMSTGVIGSSYTNPIKSGVVGSTYVSVADDFNYGKSGLAGSSYGLYRSGLPGTRVYGGSGGAAWSGWGNGKWGHYGKG